MSSDDGPVCPECNEPVSATADYCMHCYADLPSGDERVGSTPTKAEPARDTDTDVGASGEPAHPQPEEETRDGGVLDPEGVVDNVLTVVVAIVGSIVIGFVGFVALLLATGSAWAVPVGFFAWLGGLAYLARQYSVQETIGKTFYGAAAVLLLLPFVAVSPGVEGGLDERVVLFVFTLVTVAVPALVFAGIGYAVLQFAPEGR